MTVPSDLEAGSPESVSFSSVATEQAQKRQGQNQGCGVLW